VEVNRELANKPEHGSVRHLELGVSDAVVGGRKCSYQTADDLAVCPDNGAVLAGRVATRLGLAPSRCFVLRPRPSGGSNVPAPLPTPCSVEQALRYHAYLRAPVSKAALLMMADACSDTSEAAKLRHLASPEGKQAYHDYVQRDGRGVAELLAEFGSCAPAWGSLLELAPKLTPRYYTISSSPASDPSRVHLTVKVLREPMKGADGRTKEGVCSTQLAALGPGSSACVFVRPSFFHLPADPNAPIIMVGPGTGVAPFRAFLRHLAASAETAPRRGHVRLYFGCRRPKEDFLYEDELEGHLKVGTLSSLRTAFSRAQDAKVYVQHRVAEDAAELWDMLQRNGHFYICGGTSMGRDVVAALQDAIAKHGTMSATGAAEYIKEMQAQGRLMQELWS